MKEKIMSFISKKLGTTAIVSGGAMFYANEMLQMVVAGQVEVKFGLAVVAVCIVASSVQAAVYTWSQGKIDLGSLYMANKDKALEIIEAAEVVAKKKK